jgi:hypothetical protein
MTQSSKPFLTVGNGGKEELERKKHFLFNQPWLFDGDEFNQLCELFKLSRAEVFDLTMMRIENKARTNHEAAAVLAVFSESGNASDILARLRRQRFRVEASSAPALPRSSAPSDANPS